MISKIKCEPKEGTGVGGVGKGLQVGAPPLSGHTIITLPYKKNPIAYIKRYGP